MLKIKMKMVFSTPKNCISNGDGSNGSRTCTASFLIFSMSNLICPKRKWSSCVWGRVTITKYAIKVASKKSRKIWVEELWCRWRISKQLENERLLIITLWSNSDTFSTRHSWNTGWMTGFCQLLSQSPAQRMIWFRKTTLYLKPVR